MRDLAASIGIDNMADADDYPHFYYLDADDEDSCLEISVEGEVAKDFLQLALTSDVEALKTARARRLSSSRRMDRHWRAAA